MYLRGEQWIKFSKNQFQELRKIIQDNWRNLKAMTALQSPLRTPPEVAKELRASS